jgi:hypothetical protein
MLGVSCEVPSFTVLGFMHSESLGSFHIPSDISCWGFRWSLYYSTTILFPRVGGCWTLYGSLSHLVAPLGSLRTLKIPSFSPVKPLLSFMALAESQSTSKKSHWFLTPIVHQVPSSSQHWVLDLGPWSTKQLPSIFGLSVASPGGHFDWLCEVVCLDCSQFSPFPIYWLN